MDSLRNLVSSTNVLGLLHTAVPTGARDVRQFFWYSMLAFTRKRFPVLLFRLAKILVNGFKRIQIFDSETKQGMLPKVQHYAVQLALYRLRDRLIHITLFAAFYIAFWVTLVGAPFLISTSYALNFGIQMTGSESLITLAFIDVCTIAIWLHSWMISNRSRWIGITRRSVHRALLLLYFVLYVGLAAELGSSPLDIRGFYIMSIGAGVIGVLGVSYLYLESLSLFSVMFYRAQSRSYPETFLVSDLLGLLQFVERVSDDWTYVEVRRQILGYLEDAALIVQNNVYSMLKSGDPMTNVWLERTYGEIAAALRAKKKWVLTPKPDTRAYFQASIAKTVALVATGNWDALERIEQEKTPTRQIWRARAMDAMRTLFVGGLPIVLLWTIQQSPLALHNPINDYAIAGAILWALFTIVMALDPQFNAKIDAMKDISVILPLPGKGGKS